MSIDLNQEAATVQCEGRRLQGEGWLSGASAPSQVAVYVAASERVEALSTTEVVDIVRQGLDVEIANGNAAAVRDLAREVLLRRVQV